MRNCSRCGAACVLLGGHCAGSFHSGGPSRIVRVARKGGNCANTKSACPASTTFPGQRQNSVVGGACFCDRSPALVMTDAGFSQLGDATAGAGLPSISLGGSGLEPSRIVPDRAMDSAEKITRLCPCSEAASRLLGPTLPAFRVICEPQRSLGLDLGSKGVPVRALCRIVSSIWCTAPSVAGST